MISKSQIKLIRSLTVKKYRKIHRMFIAEGTKLAEESILSSFRIHKLYATAAWADAHADILQKLTSKIQPEIIDEAEMAQVSELTTPSGVLVVLELPEESSSIDPSGKLYLALDSIRDPGNLGTIIRLADWYGLPQVWCSPDCADAFNPKVVQASMGSIFRVKLIYKELDLLIKEANMPVYAAVLNGSINVHTLKETGRSILLMGNESQGISQEILKLPHTGIRIPSYGGAESLNVAMATGIILDNFSRMWD